MPKRRSPSTRRARGAELGLLYVFLSCLFGLPALHAEPRTLRVGLFPAPPLVLVQDGRPAGLFIDLLEHFARSLDWRLVYVERDWSELLLALEKGEIDILPALGRTKEREARFDFSAKPVFIDSGLLYTSRRFTVHTVFDLEGKRVAALRGSIFTEGFVSYMSTFGISCEMVLTDNNRQVMEAIAEGRVDAGVLIYSLGSALAREFPVVPTPISFSPVALAYAVPKGRQAEVIRDIDRLMAEMEDDPNSVYARSFSRWTQPPESKALPAWLSWGLAGLLALGLALGAWNILLKRQVAQKTLHLKREIAERAETQERLARSLSEKEVLLRELYHRTKNTLQVVQSLITLQADEHPGDSRLQELVRSTGEKIQAISLVHQMLYRSQDLSRISIREYIQELCASIMRGYEKAGERISLELDVEERSILLDSAIPYGLLLNELMTNSLKYAFPSDRKGRISIAYSKEASGRELLRYSDDGIGLPPGFDPRAQDSLGLRLIFAIGEQQLRGQLSLSGEKGLSCTISIPAEPGKEGAGSESGGRREALKGSAAGAS